MDHLDNDTNKVMAMVIIQNIMKNDSFISTADKVEILFELIKGPIKNLEGPSLDEIIYAVKKHSAVVFVMLCPKRFPFTVPPLVFSVLKMAHQVAMLILGVLGNIASILSFASPVPTFVEIIKGKSVFEYRPLPYIVSLLNQLVWLYYGCLLEKGGVFIIVVSAIGCVFQTAYICIYLFFATAEVRRRAFQLVAILGIFPIIFLFTVFVIQSIAARESIVGWSCVVIQTACFAAPLTIVWQVVKTKSIEFMPFALSFSLTINATMWMAYGFATDDLFIEIPNILGAVLGVAQMMIYAYYRYFYYDAVQAFVVVSDVLSFML